MKDKRGKKKGKRLTLLILLAALCIGGAELLVCRWADPELYARIMAPVSRAANEAASLGRSAVSAIAGVFRGIAGEAEQKEQELEPQVAGEPSIEEPIAIADPKITELIQRDGQDILTGGSVDMVYFNQASDTWADRPYGKDSLGRYGCGPTSMAMVVSSLTDTQVDPEEMALWAYENGHWASRSGSYHSIVQGAAEAYGLEAEAFRTFDADALRAQLASGGVMVALVTKGHFTDGGHFIVLRGVTLDGSILVADPNSVERSLTTWDPQIILDELSPSRQSGAPLWAISKAREEG